MPGKYIFSPLAVTNRLHDKRNLVILRVTVFQERHGILGNTRLFGYRNPMFFKDKLRKLTKKELVEWRRERTARKHRADRRRRFLVEPLPSTAPLFERAFRWLAPWNHKTCPPWIKALAELSANRATPRSAETWRRGQKAPDWAIEATRDLIVARCQGGMALAAELTAELERRAATPRRYGGFMLNRASAWRGGQPRPVVEGGKETASG